MRGLPVPGESAWEYAVVAFFSEDEVTSNGDAQAQFNAGLALFAKGQTLTDLNEAVELIERAAAAGYARATEYCALIECIGAGRPINWTAALDRLRDAAEQGSASAAHQLLLFADPDHELEFPQSPSARFWSEIRRRIDVARMLAPREGQTAIERPFVGVLQGFAAPGECRWLVEGARERLGPSTIYDYTTGALRGDERRTSSAAMFSFDRTDLVIEMIRARIAATLDLPLPRFEVSQVLHYAPGQEFKPHHDYFDPAAEGFQQEIAERGQRVATFLIFLNDEFTGGETRFPTLGFNYRGRIGDAIAFASVDPDGQPNPRTLHAGLPPTSGEKWIFSQWIRDRIAGAAAAPAGH